MNKVEKERKSVRQAVITGLRWLTTARFVAQVSSWAVTLIVIRLLTPADYGLHAMVAVLYSLLIRISQSGVDRAISRHPDFKDSNLSQLLGFYLLLNFALFVAVWFVAPLVAAYYQEPRVVLLLRVLAFGFVITLFKLIPVGLVWRELDYRTHAIASLIGTVSGSLVTLGIAIAGYGVWALIIGNLVVPGSAAIYLQLKKRWLVLPRFSFGESFSIVKYAWTIGAGFFVWQFAWGLDVLLGGKQIAAAELGFYVVAIHLCAMPLDKVVPLANEILYPAYSRLQSDPAAINQYFQKSLVSICFVLFPAFLGLAAISEWLVPVVFGANWIGIERIMLIVALAMPFRVLLSMCNPVLNATGSAHLSLWSGVFAVIFIAAAVSVGIHWGAIGLAYAALVSAPVVMTVVLLQMTRVAKISFSDLAGTAGSLLCVSVVMAVVVYLTGRYFDGSLANSAIIAIQVLCGALIYFMLTALFARRHLLLTVGIMRSSLFSR
ncbi:MAG: lipopolysaccharide biosynthesis protein [Gammaproteobacteria bacterium]|nr:lipopolysaccharide biosynthesis protein [Gammaproteobacteria bacterium]